MSLNLDLLDRKLLYTLDFNARMPLSKLAKKLHVSKQVVLYHLENLQKRKVIQGFYADINSSKIGYAIYLVYLKFQKISLIQEKDFIQHLSQQEAVGVSVSINGEWDYCFGVWAESMVKFKIRYQQIMVHHEQFVKNKTIMIETDFYYFKPKLLLGRKEEVQITMSGEIESYDLNKQDRLLLIHLSQNARSSLVELGALLHLTPNAVKARIKNLEKNKIVLGYRVMINYPLLDYLHYRVFLHLENLILEKEKRLIQFLKYNLNVISVTKTIGHNELEFRALVENIHQFYDLMEELRNEFSELIKDYQSIIYHQFNGVLNYFPFRN